MIEVQKSVCPSHQFKYNDADIRKMIETDFLDRCYLCEEITRHTEIDHFRPKNAFPSLENDWKNLYLICQKCNKIKPKDANTSSETELLDVCKDSTEQILLLTYNPKTQWVDIETVTNNADLNRKAQYTKMVLDKIYNGDNNTTSLSFEKLRELIVENLSQTIGLLEQWEKLPRFRQEFEKQIAERLSKKTQKAESSFVSFKRNWIRNNPKFKDFEKYFD